MSRPKSKDEIRSVNRGFRMKPSVLNQLKALAHNRGVSTNTIIENLIVNESKEAKKGELK